MADWAKTLTAGLVTVIMDKKQRQLQQMFGNNITEHMIEQQKIAVLPELKQQLLMALEGAMRDWQPAGTHAQGAGSASGTT